MPLARIIAARPEEAAAIERELRSRGFHTELARPGDVASHPAELEICVESLSRDAALTLLRDSQNAGGELLIGQGVLDRLLPKPEPKIAKAEAPAAPPAPQAQRIELPQVQELSQLASAIVPKQVAPAQPRIAVPPRLAEQKIDPPHPRIQVPAPRQKVEAPLAELQKATAKAPPPKRRPVLRPALMRTLASARKAATAIQAGSARASAHSARFGSALLTKARQGWRDATPAVKQQCSNLLLTGTRLAAGSEQTFLASYAATLSWWKARQERKRAERAVVAVENTRTSQAVSSLPAVHFETQTQLALPRSQRNSRRRDWQMALAGGVIASCLMVIVFGVTSRRTTAAAPTPVSSAPASVAPARIPVAQVSPVAAAAPVVTHKMHRIRRSAPVQSDEMADDVVVKRFDRQPTAPDPEKTSGVKYYSDLQ